MTTRYADRGTDLEAGTRICPGCGEEKPLDDYWRYAGDPVAGRMAQCKVCQIAKRRERHEANPAYYKNMRLVREYGITWDEYNARLREQDGVCAICKREETATVTRDGVTWVRDLSVDHCHETGLVRGLLCHACNTALGLLSDDIEAVKSAVVYLEAAEED